ncbi:Excalibur calcium-binding domain-containing protein [Curtobacterium sp. YR515]|nr:Excalibur calcium-binding domain-containing protein [Curtobacterium sp. YR515]
MHLVLGCVRTPVPNYPQAVHITRTLSIAAATAVIAATAVVGGASTAQAAPTVYKNCTAVQKVYSGGIAKKSVTKNRVTSKGKVTYRALKGTVKKDDALYAANKKMDADGDGIACEKS